MAPVITVRPFRRDDVGRLVELWEQLDCVPVGPDALTLDEAIDTMLDESVIALVAERQGAIVGTTFASVAGPLAHVHRVTAGEDDSGSGSERGDIVRALLDALEARLADAGARKARWVAADAAEARTLRDHGYADVNLGVLEYELPTALAGSDVLQQLGGQLVDGELWDRLAGMQQAKAIIERRVILPLARSELAAEHGVATPSAIVLFGPPGTGKTTFAKGIASRLRWPFVELEPAELARDDDASRLAAAFEQIGRLDAAVVFVDEVEDVASVRHQERRVGARVTNEFLRRIPGFRRRERHLLVCATNEVGRLDPAFLRPGRFDYVLPVGPPDAEARGAIWRRYIGDITDEDVDLDALVEASELFTPADIEYAAEKAAQFAFERAHFDDVGHRAVTEEFLRAIDETPPTLTEDTISRFEDDVERYSRT